MLRLLGTLFLLAGSPDNLDVSIYVSPAGDDVSGNGTVSKPWKSLSMARGAVRTLVSCGFTENVTVYLSEGEYELNETLEFNESDSAPSGKTVTYASKDGPGAAVLKSRSVITNSSAWSYYTNGIWRIDVGVGHDIDTLYEGDIRAMEARFPNRGANALYPQARAPYLISEDGDFLTSNSNFWWIVYDPADFSKAPATVAKTISILPYGKRNWSIWTCAITDVDTNDSRIVFDNQGDSLSAWLEGGERYFLSGALEYLDAEGEFHYDSASGYLYYKPRTPGNPAYKDISVPVLKTLVNIAGSDRLSVVRGLKFEGMGFSDTAAVVPAGPWWVFDWGKTDAATVKMRNTSGVSFETCHIKNSGRHGILAVGHNDAVHVESCLVENIGVSGIVLCNRYAGGTMDRIRNGVISNCVIQNVGNLSFNAACIGLMSTEDCVVDHCELYDSSRYAVTLRGDALLDGVGFNSMPSSKNNMVRNCWMERCMQDSGDGAPLQEAGVNIPGGPCTNWFEDIYIYNTYSVPGQDDPAQIRGVFLDWPYAAMEQSFSNVWVDICEGPFFRAHDNPTQSFFNVSWEPGFDPSQMDLTDIGLSESLPASFGFSRMKHETYKDIVIDNNDPEAVEYGSGWNDSSLGRLKRVWLDAPNSRFYQKGSTAEEHSFVWTPNLGADGYYDVSVWKFKTASASTTAAVYSVVSAGETNHFTVNQQTLPETWERIGTCYFNQGTNGCVILDADSIAEGEQVRADAVRFTAITPQAESLWEGCFDYGYVPGSNAIGQNGWATWHGESPVVQSNHTDGFFIQGVSFDDARAKQQISSSIGTNRFITIQFSTSIPDTTSTTLSQNHVGLGSYNSNVAGVNIGLNATGVFFCPDGIAMIGFVYGYIDGVQFIPDADTVYALKAEMNLLEGTAQLFVSEAGGKFLPLTFDAAGTVTKTPFDPLQAFGWDAVYVRMGTHENCRIYNIVLSN